MQEFTYPIKNFSKGLRRNGPGKNQGFLADCLNVHPNANGDLTPFRPVNYPFSFYTDNKVSATVPILFNATDFGASAYVTKDTLNNGMDCTYYNTGTGLWTPANSPGITYDWNGYRYLAMNNDSIIYRRFEYNSLGVLDFSGDFTIEVIAFRQSTTACSIFSIGADNNFIGACLSGSNIYLPALITAYCGYLTYSPSFYLGIARSAGVVKVTIDGGEIASYENTADWSGVFHIGSMMYGSIRNVSSLLFRSWRVTLGLARDISAVPILPLTAEL